MKRLRNGLLVLIGFLAGHAGAVSVTNGESWVSGDTAGWVAYDLINEVVVSNPSYFSVSNTALKVGFKSYLDPKTGRPNSMPMPPEEYLVKAGPTASSGQFTGDYLSSGVAAVSFRLYCDAPVKLWLAFRNETTNRWWQLPLCGIQTGVWQAVTVPVDPAVLRELGGRTDWDSFSQDIRNVSWIGVIVRRDSALNRQTVMIDDFSLSGPGAEFAAWMSQFSPVADGGARVGRNTLPDGDLDGDGLKNMAEWIAGTSAGDSNDNLRLTIEPRQGKGARLKWKAKAGRAYEVWRCTDLKQGFTLVEPSLVPGEGDSAYDDQVQGGPVFYRVEVRTNP